MIVRIYNKSYRINKNIASSAKTTILRILEKVREESDVRDFHAYYIGFVIMMYVVSSTILSQFSTENIKSVLEELNDSEKKRKPE